MIDPEGLFRLVQFFDILAAVVFAVSGSLVASRKGMDVMGFMWFAVITGVGGGTLRDLILGVPLDGDERGLRSDLYHPRPGDSIRLVLAGVSRVDEALRSTRP